MKVAVLSSIFFFFLILTLVASLTDELFLNFIVFLLPSIILHEHSASEPLSVQPYSGLG